MSTLLILSRHLLDTLLSSWSPVWVTIPNFPHKIALRAFLYFSQGFWYFARSQTREIQVFPRNSPKNAKYREIHQKYFQIHVGKTYLILILAIRPVLFTPNVQIYLETSSLQRVNNVPKLPGVFRWTLRKTGH